MTRPNSPPVPPLPPHLTDWLPGKRVGVVGLQRTGLAVARELSRHGADVLAVDTMPAVRLGKTPRELEELGADVVCGKKTFPELGDCALVVLSPGVPFDDAPLTVLRSGGVPVIGEVEFAFRLTMNPFVAVSGTKGKSTTVNLVGAMLAAADIRHRVCGNLGNPVSGELSSLAPDELLVVEVSSFQLESTFLFRPHSAALLNVAEDHLDRHGGMDDYVAAKMKLLANLTKKDRCYLNRDDSELRKLSPPAAVSWISLSGPVDQGGWLSAEGELHCKTDSFSGTLCSTEDLRLPGRHNLANALFAAVMALDLGASEDAVRKALAGFTGVEHRLERVAEIGGVTYWNDSAATTPLAAAAGLEAMPGSTLVLLGGRAKTTDFSRLDGPLRRKVKVALCLGEAGPRFADLAEQVGIRRVLRVASVEDGVQEAARFAEPGDHVLLSPACASFDQFKDYSERGDCFRQAVAALRGERR